MSTWQSTFPARYRLAWHSWQNHQNSNYRIYVDWQSIPLMFVLFCLQRCWVTMFFLPLMRPWWQILHLLWIALKPCEWFFLFIFIWNKVAILLDLFYLLRLDMKCFRRRCWCIWRCRLGQYWRQIWSSRHRCPRPGGCRSERIWFIVFWGVTETWNLVVGFK